MCLEKLVEFADNSTIVAYDADILFQIKMISICARLIMWKQHSTNVEWPAGITFEDVSEVAT